MIKLEKSKIKTNYYEIYVDDSLCEKAYANGSDEKHLMYWSKSQISSKRLGTQVLKDFNEFEFIYLTDYFDWTNVGLDIGISSSLRKFPANQS